MKNRPRAFRLNLKQAKAVWGDIPKSALQGLRELTRKLALSVAAGDLQLLQGRWYVTHSGLLRVAQRRRCLGISTAVDEALSRPADRRWVVKATVYKDSDSKGFEGYGDADPANVSSVVLGAEMRIAETRAVNRALRKAYGIGLCSIEELGSSSLRPETGGGNAHRFAPSNGNGSNGQPKLRDRLCVLIRKYDLDAARVKRYAADFCGTEVLRNAGWDLVESFIVTLEGQAANNREALICKLNSYPLDQEVHS